MPYSPNSIQTYIARKASKLVYFSDNPVSITTSYYALLPSISRITKFFRKTPEQ